jgi:hypothetical protein
MIVYICTATPLATSCGRPHPLKLCHWFVLDQRYMVVHGMATLHADATHTVGLECNVHKYYMIKHQLRRMKGKHAK